MSKTFITNHKGLELAILIEGEGHPNGLVFIMHGLGGHKEQPHIKTMAEAFLANHYTVVRFDATNALGESGGTYEDATITTYYEDLKDVIEWAQNQPWYREPFVLAGHSLGAISSALYAERYPEKVRGLAPISTVVSGDLSAKSPLHEHKVKEWKETGYTIKKSSSRPDVELKLPWSHMQDRLKYDLLPKADRLSMPVLLVVGEVDTGTPPQHQQILFEKLPGPKEMHIIPGAPHTFKTENELSALKHILDTWIKKL